MKPKQRTLLLLLLLPALLLLVACGGGAEPEATEPPPTVAEEEPAEPPAEEEPAEEEPEAPAEEEAAPTDTAVPPTETSEPPTETPEPPTPEPTDTPEPPTPDSTAGFVDYENPEQGVSFSYPEEWILDDSFFITVASNDALIDGPDTGEEGAVTLIFTASPDEFEGQDPAGMMDEFAAESFAEEEGVEIIEGPTELTINGQDAATMVLRGPAEEDDDRSILVLITTISSDERVAVVLATTPEESADEFRPLLEAIAQSVELMAPVQAEPEEGDEEGTVAPETGIEELPAGAAGAISPGTLLTATLQEGTADSYTFAAVAGEPLLIMLNSGEELDATLAVLDPEGNVVDQVDSALAGHVETLLLSPSADGEYTARVQGFSDEGGTYSIGLLSQQEEAADVFLVDSSEVTTDEGNEYTLTAAPGEAFLIAVEVADEDFDVVAEIYDAQGELLLEEDQAFAGDREAIIFFPPAEEEYTLVVRGFAGATGSYTVTIGGAAIAAGE